MPTKDDAGPTWIRRTPAAAAVVLLLLAASCGPGASSASHSNSPTSGAIPIPALSKTFTSPRMGYSVKYPGEWTAISASATWKHGTPDLWNDPELDKLNGKGVEFRGTSQVLAAGETPQTWIDQYLASSSPCGQKEQATVDGQSGTIDANGCASDPVPGHLYDSVFVVGGRGYNFAMEGKVDHAFFLAMLATVTFAPTTATG